jgi:predicted ABC-type transport system involved in lysophospholipase L1 biosynthesis ATPase subunit
MLEFARRPGHALLAVLHRRELEGRGGARIRLEDGRLEAV